MQVKLARASPASHARARAFFMYPFVFLHPRPPKSIASPPTPTHTTHTPRNLISHRLSPLFTSSHPFDAVVSWRAVLVAEVIAHFYPRLVELHNYSSANSLSQKMYNWNTLNGRVLKRLGKGSSPCTHAHMKCTQARVHRVHALTPSMLRPFLF